MSLLRALGLKIKGIDDRDAATCVFEGRAFLRFTEYVDLNSKVHFLPEGASLLQVNPVVISLGYTVRASYNPASSHFGAKA